MKELVKNIFTNIEGFIREHVFAVSIGLLVFIMTYLLFGGWEKLYLVGGDDARLYYVFPYEYIKSYLLNIVTNNFLGGINYYWSPSAYLPFVTVILLIKKFFVLFNTQGFLYALNISVGFISFYFLLGLWLKEKQSRIISSLLYIFSVFITKSFYLHQLASMYIVSVFPLCLYFLFLGFKKKSVVPVLLSITIYSVFSSTILTYPWYAATIVCVFPIIVSESIIKYHFPLKSILLSVLVFLLLNSYWLLHIIFPVIVKSGSLEFASTVISQAFKYQNSQMIIALSELNPPYHQISSYIRMSWNEIYNSGLANSYGIIVLIVIFLAGVFIQRTRKQNKEVYILSTICLLISMLFVTPNLGRWNLDLFLFLNNNIPFFTVFRNMYDKFAYAMAFTSAFAICASFLILKQRLRKNLFRLCYLAVLCVVIVNAYGFYQKLYFEHRRIGFSGTFNSDYLSLVSYVKKQGSEAKYLWLPLNTPSYVTIEDGKNPNLFYYGVSPLQFLAGASDLTGFTSFSTKSEPELNGVILSLLQKKDFKKVGEIFQKLDVRYIIVNKDRVPEWGKDHLNENNELNLQTQEFYDTLLGEKIEDFGSRYSLYNINDKFLSDTFFTSQGSVETYPNQRNRVDVVRLKEGQYDLVVPFNGEETQLYFQEAYSAYWQLIPLDKDVKVTSHNMAFNYSNVWSIRSSSGYLQDNRVHFRLVFTPSKINRICYFISFSTYLGCFVFFIYAGYKKISENRHLI